MESRKENDMNVLVPKGFVIGTAEDEFTGVTVILAQKGAMGGADCRGGAPGTRETDLLRPEKMMDKVNAVVLSGGSAYGLASMTGVMEWLAAKGCGYKSMGKLVPIVTGAVLYDLNQKELHHPDAKMGFQACENAGKVPFVGQHGAGKGATVGKIRGRMMSEIADQIEREEDGHLSRMRVLSVVCDMERHVSGAEGAEDSPVARWSRELRDALTSNEVEKMKCGHADDVSMSAYDLLSEEERDAIAWVREHGGLARVKDIHHDFRAVVERLGVEWSESELHGLMDVLDKRLMPEGYTWPRDEFGEKVLASSEIADGLGHAHTVTSIEFSEGLVALHWNPGEPEECVLLGRGERARRPDSLERLEADVRDIWNEVRYHLGDYSPSDFRQQGDSVCERIAGLPCRIRTLVERDAK